MFGRRGRPAGPPDAEPGHCSLCGRARAQVALLVAGTEGAVCDACAVAALAAQVDPRQGRRPETLAYRAVEALLADLPAHAPRATSGALVGAALALAGTDAAARRHLADRALALSNPGAALAAIDGIDAGERVPGDALIAALAEGMDGRPRRGLERLADLRAELLDDVDRADFVLVRAHLSRRARLRAPDSLDDLRAAVEQIERAGDAVRGAGSFAVCELAAALVAAGRAAEAERELLARERALSTTPRYHLVRGDALAALGRGDEARRHWSRAAADGHPESALVREATERLRRGYR